MAERTDARHAPARKLGGQGQHLLFGGGDARHLFTGSGAYTIDDLWRGRFTSIERVGDDLRVAGDGKRVGVGAEG